LSVSPTAIEAKIGKFESANGGTLLLDEIAEMPCPLHAKLLHALQEKINHRQWTATLSDGETITEYDPLPAARV
jgi:predicted ATP-dependent protease